MARILITGASGYIGSCAARYLRERGHDVTATSRRNPERLAAELPGCETATLDVLSIPDELEGAWDVILHTATANDILSRDFAAGVALSSVGTKNVLALARRTGVGHVLFLSTLQVYGTELNGTLTEESPAKPETDYGLNHWFGEQVCELESARHGLRTTILRPANVYGCPVSRTVDRWSLVPTCFVREALASGKITLRSSGLQRRDFVSLRQVAAACGNVIDSTGTGCAVRNVATGETHSVLDAARWTVAAFEAAGLPAPEVEILGEEPRQANRFSVISSVTPPPAGGSVEAEMSSEISKLIDFFREVGNVSPLPQ
jgi:nucleoside-diphosphate-sugar epimerase